MGGACVADVTPGSRCHGNNREREKDRHQRTIGKRPLAMRRGNAANPLNLRCYLPVYLAIHGRYTNNTCTDWIKAFWNGITSTSLNECQCTTKHRNRYDVQPEALFFLFFHFLFSSFFFPPPPSLSPSLFVSSRSSYSHFLAAQLLNLAERSKWRPHRSRCDARLSLHRRLIINTNTVNNVKSLLIALVISVAAASTVISPLVVRNFLLSNLTNRLQSMWDVD